MSEFLYNILAWIQSWVGNWGWAMVVFTIMVRLVLTPLDIKSRASMRKTQKLQPQIQALQKKYANDKEKLNAKTAELYKKAHVNPLSSCLPLLLTWPILIAVFSAMRTVANKELLLQVGQILNKQTPSLENWLWIKNLWMPDSLFAASMPDLNTLRVIPTDQWVKWFESWSWGDLPAAIKSLGLTAESFNPENIEGTIGLIRTAMDSISAAEWQTWIGSINMSQLPEAIQALGLTANSFDAASMPTTLASIKEALGNLSATDWAALLNNLRMAKAPLLIKDLGLTVDSFSKANLDATVQQIVEVMKQNPTYLDAMKTGLQFNLLLVRPTLMVQYNGWLLLPILSAVSQIAMTKIMGAGTQQPAAEGQAASTGKFMQYFFPIFSLFICLSYSAAFALYWVAGNLVSMGQTFAINKYLDKKEAAAADVVGEGSVK